jgi:biotin transport system substrate-specific component
LAASVTSSTPATTTARLRAARRGAAPTTSVATMLGYLAAGAAGLPVFSGTPERGIGLAYMAGR